MVRMIHRDRVVRRATSIEVARWTARSLLLVGRRRRGHHGLQVFRNRRTFVAESNVGVAALVEWHLLVDDLPRWDQAAGPFPDADLDAEDLFVLDVRRDRHEIARFHIAGEIGSRIRDEFVNLTSGEAIVEWICRRGYSFGCEKDRIPWCLLLYILRDIDLSILVLYT